MFAFKKTNGRFLAAAVLLFVVLGTGCLGNSNSLPYEETFDQQGSWSAGEDTYSAGQVHDGVYDFTLLDWTQPSWAAAGEEFSDGVYSVDARPVAGPLDNGYGLIFRADPEKGDFYLFEVSADGFIWIGRYKDGTEDIAIVGDHWFESPAVKKGLNITNNLRVEAEAGNMVFYVNGQEVGRVTDTTYASGDVGLLVQAFRDEDVQILFDNLKVESP